MRARLVSAARLWFAARKPAPHPACGPPSPKGEGRGAFPPVPPVLRKLQFCVAHCRKLCYNTRIGDKGVYLSGGESQRVCVARAILKNAPILVLDEATAFADPENEYKMQQAIQQLIKDKTVIIIAHRLSSIISAEQILVLKEGRLIQSGRHEVLSKTDGVYKRMWDAYTSAFRWQLTVKKEETK